MLVIQCASVEEIMAQNELKEPGSFISVGVGYPNIEILSKYLPFQRWLFSASLFVPSVPVKVNYSGPFYLKYEHLINKKLGVGLVFNYSQGKANWQDSGSSPQGNGYYLRDFDFIEKRYVVLVRLNHYYEISTNLLLYSGVGLGFRSIRSIHTISYFDKTGTYQVILDSGNTAWPIGFEGTIGIKKRIPSNFMLFAEFGIGRSLIHGGLAYTF